MGLLWEDRAWEEYLYWQMQDRKTLKRLNAIIRDIQRNSLEGIGKSERLKGNRGADALMRRIVLSITSRMERFILLPAVDITRADGPYLCPDEQT